MSGLDGLWVLITAGPTREHLDPVRFLSNPSSGRMGYALAEEAAARGAQVVLVSGPTALADPVGVQVERVTSAEEMMAACRRRFADCEVLVAVAAVADLRPAKRHAEKRKKEQIGLTLELERTPDIVATLAAEKDGRFVVGFAAETADLLASAAAKLERKRLDLIVANDVGDPAVGFASTDNRVVILAPDGRRVRLGPAPKREIARGIWDTVAERLEPRHSAGSRRRVGEPPRR
ncbi:MAG: phosphopantothenoylcysteine decarboxylase [Thermoanaerobaculia bacterium]